MISKMKGFLGPIGDDLPSLIPLVFGLTIFFSVFTTSWNAFEQQNESFNDDIALLKIAGSLKANSYIADHDVFMKRCREAQSTMRVSFKAGLIPLPVTLDEPFGSVDAESIKFFTDPITDELYECGNTEETPSQDSHNILKLSFPVALERDYMESGQRHFFVKPMLLVVIAWR